MKSKSENQHEENKILPQQVYLEPPVLGKLLKRHGVYDGKYFHSHNKVTYTFIDNHEVIALHFDKSRKEIYYKGHHIENLALTEDQIGHLKQFAVLLEKNEDIRTFAKSFKFVLQRSLKKF